MAASEPALTELYPEVFDKWDTEWRVEDGNRAKFKLCELRRPSDRLHRLVRLAYWWLIKRAAMTLEHPRPVTERSEEAITRDIKEHVEDLGRGCLSSQLCSDECNVLRSYLRWPEGIPLNNPETFKSLGNKEKELREGFVRAVYWQEMQAEDGNHSLMTSPLPSIWSLKRMVGSGLSLSETGMLCTATFPRTRSWRVSPMASFQCLSDFGSSMDICEELEGDGSQNVPAGTAEEDAAGWDKINDGLRLPSMTEVDTQAGKTYGRSEGVQLEWMDPFAEDSSWGGPSTPDFCRKSGVEGRLAGGGPFTESVRLQGGPCEKVGCNGSCDPNKKPKALVPPGAEGLFDEGETEQTGSLVWTRGKEIHLGPYGKVFAGKNQENGQLMIVKQLISLELQLETLKWMHQLIVGSGGEYQRHVEALEHELSCKMHHRHIVSFINMEEDDVPGSLYVFLEWVCPWSIQQLLPCSGGFDEWRVRVYTCQLLQGLEYLHDCNIIHGDIRCGNIIMDGDGVIKLAGFGALKAFRNDTGILPSWRVRELEGRWPAPDVSGGAKDGRKADIWSVGCTVIQMLTGRYPSRSFLYTPEGTSNGHTVTTASVCVPSRRSRSASSVMRCHLRGEVPEKAEIRNTVVNQN
ncbi:MEKK and related serine/threonine protein kinases [Klebsormidium nitens]|uniref:MEKK and related serine/threonine protein kinases n=1 Tax=Klebsormidium nitens TaxID=105231 RepID=A0A1Y1I579_KLENI|nr:MEKK and related serine/threonine protein kinases [Klebsormidium nitens]|eukprot:GAQ84321.1 MEKK and related serine/threonine protein kinases [Klebsormidium nitens]